MADRIEDGGPAFPLADQAMPNDQWQDGSPGMSLRDWFAGTLPGPSEDRIQQAAKMDKFANPHNEPGKPKLRDRPEIIADLRYAQADAMLSARQKGGA